MFESLKKRFEEEKGKNSEVAGKFAAIQNNRFGQSAGAGQALAVSKQNICNRGVQFCEEQKKITQGWITTIGESMVQEQGNGGRDYE